MPLSPLKTGEKPKCKLLKAASNLKGRAAGKVIGKGKMVIVGCWGGRRGGRRWKHVRLVRAINLPCVRL